VIGRCYLDSGLMWCTGRRRLINIPKTAPAKVQANTKRPTLTGFTVLQLCRGSEF
jgi:hypothetical protein